MPTVCDGCQFYSADDARRPCPACGTPLRFTLLPPLNAEPDPLVLSPADQPPPTVRRHERDAAARTATPVYDVLTSTPFLAVCAVGLFVVLLGLLWAGIEQSQVGPNPAPR